MSGPDELYRMNQSEIINEVGRSCNFSVSEPSAVDLNQSIHLCSSNGFFLAYTLSLICHLRLVGSNLPIVANHCNDMTLDIQLILTSLPFVSVKNLCPNFTKEEGDFFRSPYCKNLAEENEIMLVDLDTAWLYPPEAAFETPGYKETGTLFMYDVISLGGNTDDVILLHDAIIMGLSKLNAIEKMWEYISNSFMFRGLSIYEQESSLVLFNRSKTQKAINKLKSMIEERVLFGLLDKEMYWIACVLSGTPYSFTPWLSGNFGRTNNHCFRSTCCSHIQYIPWTVASRYAELQPVFYVNGAERIDIHPQKYFHNASSIFQCDRFDREISKPLTAIEGRKRHSFVGRSVPCVRRSQREFQPTPPELLVAIRQRRHYNEIFADLLRNHDLLH